MRGSDGKPRRWRVLGVVIALGALTGAAVSATGEKRVDAVLAHAAAGTAAPVVMELFTSQGCSSCPAADALLTALDTADVDHGALIPLAYHVDYWNRLGWADPFSRSEWTARQQRYARAFRSTSVYTPQMVVNGSAEFSGSNGTRALDAVQAAARRPPVARVAVRSSQRDAKAGRWRIEIEAEVLRPLVGAGADVLVAVYENGLRTDVPRGENAGRTLHNDHVVRRLLRAFTVSATPGPAVRRTVDIALDPGWNAEAVGIAIFLQDPRTLAIYAAADQSLRISARERSTEGPD